MYTQITDARQAKVSESQRVFESKMLLDAIQKEDNFLRVQISELTALQNEEDKYMKRAESIASERNPFDDLIKSYDITLANVLEKHIPFTKQFAALKEETEHVEYWIKVFGHIRIKLFETVCNFLDEQTNTYLKQLKNPQLRVQFSTIKRLASGEVKEDFNVRVYSEKGGEGFDTLSGGEQQIVSFAIGKALGDLSKSQTKGSSEFQILDEPFSMLDPRNCEALVDFLGKEKGTIMLISNDENLMNLVPERLHVEKYKGVTSIANGG
jgi:DNA repair exonuclease SbcCD ATPase subunit